MAAFRAKSWALLVCWAFGSGLAVWRLRTVVRLVLVNWLRIVVRLSVVLILLVLNSLVSLIVRVTPIWTWVILVLVVLASYRLVFGLTFRNVNLVVPFGCGSCLRVFLGVGGKRLLLIWGSFGIVCRRCVILIGLVLLRRATMIRLLLLVLQICI